MVARCSTVCQRWHDTSTRSNSRKSCDKAGLLDSCYVKMRLHKRFTCSSGGKASAASSCRGYSNRVGRLLLPSRIPMGHSAHFSATDHCRQHHKYSSSFRQISMLRCYCPLIHRVSWGSSSWRGLVTGIYCPGRIGLRDPRSRSNLQHQHGARTAEDTESHNGNSESGLKAQSSVTTFCKQRACMTRPTQVQN